MMEMMRRWRIPVLALLAVWLPLTGPARALEAGSDVVSGVYDSNTGNFSSPEIVNYVVGAQRFYDSGYFGQSVIIANVEAGHIWSGHEVFDRSGFGLPNSPALSYNATSNPVTSPELGSVDYHATMVGNVLAGTGDLHNGSLSLLGMGMAPFAALWSGAIATSWDHTPANIGSFEISEESFLAPYKAFFEGALGSRPDVINSSWGFDDPAARAGENRILDALAAANTTVAFVRSAGNGGPTAAPGTGFNGITVGSLGGGADARPFLRASDFTSGAAADFYNPGTGVTVTGVRAAVAIAAPGEDFALAAYLQKTGSLRDYWTTSDPTNDLYFVNQSGTSFSSPVVAGGVGLLKDAAHGDANLSGRAEAFDTRVIKSVIQAGATETTGWNNGQQLVSGVVKTTQSLDYAVGAGRLDLDKAWTIYADGTTDVPGATGGAIAADGWDFGTVSAGAPNDYFFNLAFSGDTQLTISLNWFVDDLFDDATGTASYGDFANLDLEVWSVVNGAFVQEVASSESLYNNTEFLRFVVGGGSYGLRVTFGGTVYNLDGASSSESYGLAWDAVAVPEPATWGASATVLLLGLILLRRRGRTAGWECASAFLRAGRYATPCACGSCMRCRRPSFGASVTRPADGPSSAACRPSCFSRSIRRPGR